MAFTITDGTILPSADLWINQQELKSKFCYLKRHASQAQISNPQILSYSITRFDWAYHVHLYDPSENNLQFDEIHSMDWISIIFPDHVQGIRKPRKHHKIWGYYQEKKYVII
jgi:hypothetical protein